MNYVLDSSFLDASCYKNEQKFWQGSLIDYSSKKHFSQQSGGILGHG